MSEIFGKKNYKESLKGLCCVEVSGESCANCLTLMPILKSIADARGDIRLVHVEADYDTTALMEEWDVCRVPTVLLMDDGKISAVGTHEELMQNSAIYREVYTSQKEGGNIDG